jgi:hypothetical protein
VNAGRGTVDMKVQIKTGLNILIVQNSGVSEAGFGRCVLATNTGTGFPVYCSVEGRGSAKAIRAAMCSVYASNYGTVACVDGR